MADETTTTDNAKAIRELLAAGIPFVVQQGSEGSAAMSEIGLKLDGEKDRWDLMPVAAARAIVKVLGFGARRYGDGNWRLVQYQRRRYYAAAMRHITAWWDGEAIDPDSGLHHLAHACCSLIFLLAVEEEKVVDLDAA